MTGCGVAYGFPPLGAHGGQAHEIRKPCGLLSRAFIPPCNPPSRKVDDSRTSHLQADRNPSHPLQIVAREWATGPDPRVHAFLYTSRERARGGKASKNGVMAKKLGLAVGFFIEKSPYWGANMGIRDVVMACL